MPDSRGKSHVRIAVFTILAIHVVLLGALLMAGCKKTTTENAANAPGTPPGDNTEIPPFQADSNAPPVAPTETGSVTPPPSNLAQNPGATPPPSTPVPAAPVTPTPVPETPTTTTDTGVAGGTATEHVIVKGDTFGGLAKKYHVTLKALTGANPGVQPSRLKIGQKITIPRPSSTASAGAASTTGDASAAGGEIVHVVKSNDTLWALAKKYGVSQNAIKSANGLRTSSLKVGQKLKIPAKNGGGLSPAPAPVLEPVPAPAPSAGTPVQ